MSKRRNPTDTDGNNNATQGTSVAKTAPQRFKDSYEEVFPFLTSPKKGLAFAYCLAFEKDFTRAHGHDGGKDDCRRHAKSKAHVDLKELKLTQKPLKHYQQCRNGKHQGSYEGSGTDVSLDIQSESVTFMR
jgi:hypothetical protein